MTTAAAATIGIPVGTWAVDPAHSSVEFQVKHLGIATVRGHFDSFGGTLEVGEDGEARAHGTVEAASIDTNNPGRDEDLRSAGFFDAERYPEIRFEARSVRPTGDETFEITGDLSLHGVTREVTLAAELTGRGEDLSGNERVGLEIDGEIDRRDFGITFNQVVGGGNALVSDKVKLHLDVSAVRQ